ncbi:MAG: DpnD/PcfM family protein [Oscillospiraceae bacterium]|nr:DpnD/PcfM family protein [Oscillospiraceae bacterium]
MYRIRITERLVMVVEAEADDEAEAKEQVKDDWFNQEYVLDSENFASVEFECVKAR